MVLLRLTVKVAPRLEGEQAKDEDGPRSTTSFLMVIHQPDKMSLGELAWRISEQWKKLRPEAEPLKIKKLLDDNHDADELDADLTVADVFIDYGKARADGLDQRGTLRVIPQSTNTPSIRYGSVVQDWDSITTHHSRRAPRLERRQLPPSPVANGPSSASPVKNNADTANGDAVQVEVAESVLPLCSIEEEPPAFEEREFTQETTDTNLSELPPSPLDAFPSSTRPPRYHRARLGKDSANPTAGADTSLLSSQAASQNRNRETTKSLRSAVDSHPSLNAAHPEERGSKRARIIDSDELLDQSPSSDAKQKRSKRQRVTETPAPEPQTEDEEMLDFLPVEPSIGKALAFLYSDKKNADAQQNLQEPVKESLKGAPAVTGKICTTCKVRPKSTPKPNQLGLGITASPPKIRTVNKLDIQRDKSSAPLTSKAPGHLTRPRPIGTRQNFTDITQDVPSSTKSSKDKNAMPSKKDKANAKKKPTVPLAKTNHRESKTNSAIGESWTNEFDCRLPNWDHRLAIDHVADIIQAAKEVDDSQVQIPILEKLLENMKILRRTTGSPRRNARKRVIRSIESLEQMAKPKLGWENPQHNENEEDVSTIYGPPQSSSTDEESNEEEDGARSERFSPDYDSDKEVDGELMTDPKAVKQGEEGNEGDSGNENENQHNSGENDEGRIDEEDELENMDEEEEEENHTPSHIRVSPSLSDPGNERLSITGSRGSSKKNVRDQSPSIDSVAWSGSETREPDPGDLKTGSERASGGEEDDETTPRAKEYWKKPFSQASAAASKYNELLSVSKQGEELESRGTTRSEKDTDDKPKETQQEQYAEEKVKQGEEEASSSSEEEQASDNDENDEQIDREKAESSKGESSSDEDSNPGSEDEDAVSNADTSKKTTAKKEAAEPKDSDTSSDTDTDSDSDSDSDSSSASEGSDIQCGKQTPEDGDMETAQQLSAKKDKQNKPPTAPMPRKKAHVLKRSKTSLHAPFQSSRASASNKMNLASSPLAEDKSIKPEFVTFSQPAPTATRGSPAGSGGTSPRPTSSIPTPWRNSSLNNFFKKDFTRNMFSST